MWKKTLIIGGARSGKSALALAHAKSMTGKRIFIATAEAIDDEMAVRISRHKAERQNDFTTVEAPVELSAALMQINSETGVNVVVIDCLTVWLGNLFYKFDDEAIVKARVDKLVKAFGQCNFNLIIVSNEVGLSIVPETSLGRLFRDHAGWLNQAVASEADEVILCVCGIPMIIKNILKKV